ncbi:hypothetical protein SAMN05216343_10739 [Oscillibacter sp. PC13]|nr:hypothetical protein SAMN05216343_10739 [Oscillibacter sp. PC13]
MSVSFTMMQKGTTTNSATVSQETWFGNQNLLYLLKISGNAAMRYIHMERLISLSHILIWSFI